MNVGKSDEQPNKLDFLKQAGVRVDAVRSFSGISKIAHFVSAALTGRLIKTGGLYYCVSKKSLQKHQPKQGGAPSCKKMIDTIVQQQAQQRERYKIPQQMLEQALKGARFQISKNDFIGLFRMVGLDVSIFGMLESMGIEEKDTDIALDKKVFYEKMEPYLELLPEGKIRELCAKPKKEVDLHKYDKVTQNPKEREFLQFVDSAFDVEE